MKNLKDEILVAVEDARQHLEYAIDAKDAELEQRCMFTLMELFDSLYRLDLEEKEMIKTILKGDVVKVISMNEYKKSKLDTNKDLILIYSDAYPDGLLCTQEAYRAIVRDMDECDRQSHVPVLVDPSMAASLTETINEIITLEDYLNASKIS